MKLLGYEAVVWSILADVAIVMTMIVVTHEIGFARMAAHRAVLIDGGVIVEEGNPDQFFTAPTQERTRQFLNKVLDFHGTTLAR